MKIYNQKNVNQQIPGNRKVETNTCINTVVNVEYILINNLFNNRCNRAICALELISFAPI